MSNVLVTRSKNCVFIDENKKVIHRSDFDVIIGDVLPSGRFVIECNNITNQGLTPEMLDIISKLIRIEMGIGAVRNIPKELLTEDESTNTVT